MFRLDAPGGIFNGAANGTYTLITPANTFSDIYANANANATLGAFTLAIDITRATRLQTKGYRVWTLAIPEVITPKNRLLLAAPSVFRRSA